VSVFFPEQSPIHVILALLYSLVRKYANLSTGFAVTKGDFSTCFGIAMSNGSPAEAFILGMTLSKAICSVLLRPGSTQRLLLPVSHLTFAHLQPRPLPSRWTINRVSWVSYPRRMTCYGFNMILAAGNPKVCALMVAAWKHRWLKTNLLRISQSGHYWGIFVMIDHWSCLPMIVTSFSPTTSLQQTTCMSY
jgi:hypothetical protein